MALFAKATILLNELVLILCLVYLHEWEMKDGKYRSKKPVEIKTMSIKRNVKPKHVPHMIIQHFGSRLTLGNPPDRPTEVPDFWGPLTEK